MNKTRMRAVVVSDDGPQMADVPIPQPSNEQILVKVAACTVNRADLHVAAGHKHGTTGGSGAVIGIEWAGEIAALGAGVPPGFQVGDRVMCSGTGAYAEYAVADRGRVYKLPSPALNFVQASALPVALQTAHEALTASGGLQREQAVLVQGASSGVGIMTMQVAKHLGAGLVIGTSTDPERRRRLEEFGADLVLDSRDDQWVDAVRKATGDHGVDLLIDFIAGDLMNDNMRATRVLGRIVNVGRMGGFRGEFDFDLHSLRRIQYIGATFRTRTIQEVRDIASRMQNDLWEALARGALSMPIARTYKLEEAAQALAFVAANQHFGKVALEICNP